jgi:WD40 repeat protein
LKLVNVEKQQVEEVLFTSHKVPSAIDSSSESTLLTGHEDAIIRLWDVRSGASEKTFKAVFESHSKWVSSVRFNPTVENVFVSGSFDGTVKLWDLRNEEAPLATLKKKDADEEYKVFDVEWNGPSQIVSGGSDSHVSIHTLQ